MNATLKNHEVKSQAELANLIRDYKENGNKDAFQQVVLANIKLVHFVADNYKRYGMDFDDIVSNGTMGLMHAIELFDCGKGATFATYARWWIRKYIENGFETNRQVKTKHYEYMSQDEKCEHVAQSLDEEIDDERTRMDKVVSNVPTPMQEILEREKLERLAMALESLDERERDIVKAKYAMGEYDTEVTNVALAVKYGVSHEAIRQISEKALAKIRTFLTRR